MFLCLGDRPKARMENVSLKHAVFSAEPGDLWALAEIVLNRFPVQVHGHELFGR